MKRDDTLKILKDCVTDEIVVAVYQTMFDWAVINPRDLNFTSVGVMGQASSHGLGFALSRPDKRVLVFDGDGSLLMNLGSLVSIAGAAPANFVHFVFINGTYEVNGAHPTPNAGEVDFAGMAEAAGYRRAWTFSDIENFRAAAAEVTAAEGPVMAALHIEPGAPYPRDYTIMHGAGARERFTRALRAA